MANLIAGVNDVSDGRSDTGTARDEQATSSFPDRHTFVPMLLTAAIGILFAIGMASSFEHYWCVPSVVAGSCPARMDLLAGGATDIQAVRKELTELRARGDSEESESG